MFLKWFQIVEMPSSAQWKIVCEKLSELIWQNNIYREKIGSIVLESLDINNISIQ